MGIAAAALIRYVFLFTFALDCMLWAPTGVCNEQYLVEDVWCQG
jgi:hypothetical protein